MKASCTLSSASLTLASIRYAIENSSGRSCSNVSGFASGMGVSSRDPPRGRGAYLFVEAERETKTIAPASPLRRPIGGCTQFRAGGSSPLRHPAHDDLAGG